MKIVYSDPKTGKTAQIQLDKERESIFINHNINDVVDGSALGLVGYKLKITGGSDTSGFGLDRSITGAIKTKVLKRISTTGRHKGQYRRSTVRGGMISNDTALVNTIIVEYGEKPVTELFPETQKKEEGKKD
jgi:small subunit ribosomal protein S6e